MAGSALVPSSLVLSCCVFVLVFDCLVYYCVAVFSVSFGWLLSEFGRQEKKSGINPGLYISLLSLF